MKICFPVQKDEGLTSEVYGHFGSAPLFLIYDTATKGILAVNNRDQHHVHGACNPIKALDNQSVDAVVVGGIGAGALGKLNQLGIRVHRAQAERIAENVALFDANSLPELTLQGCCGGHGHGGGCAH
ncbi:MAG: NifB/NifX family molybdenum-iron cluster-binding protein [Nitrospiraceae bacterium]|nr:NifB/NifX family molybdenum-iron cluster-binding protein [Nitrospiraceae bacterium]